MSDELDLLTSNETPSNLSPTSTKPSSTQPVASSIASSKSPLVYPGPNGQLVSPHQQSGMNQPVAHKSSFRTSLVALVVIAIPFLLLTYCLARKCGCIKRKPKHKMPVYAPSHPIVHHAPPPFYPQQQPYPATYWPNNPDYSRKQQSSYVTQ
ncbi:hypothetical protein NEOLI_004807 [Neolecta irregularis DAH-3]|uniref:Uncharacterized protein n=1 Tax=Neolecta irregularis (strain DAH-3) TaxID=1198029 RepID=A0A1U7LQ65_NEOID|nr:hypothetical protein NEOLI_004807 [Neolecta irregularis DAH-3]|eukprot:OLL24805.1 hypothetical protein NEOLI_004807 [Neolecta irregularis DAH-3]